METVTKFKNCLYALGCTPETTFYVKDHNSKRSMWTLTRRTNKLSDEYHCNSLKVIKTALGITTHIEQRHCPLGGNLSMIEVVAKLYVGTHQKNKQVE